MPIWEIIPISVVAIAVPGAIVWVCVLLLRSRERRRELETLSAFQTRLLEKLEAYDGTGARYTYPIHREFNLALCALMDFSASRPVACAVGPSAGGGGSRVRCRSARPRSRMDPADTAL